MPTASNDNVPEPILAASGDVLRSSLALLSELSLFNLLIQKSADWFNSGCNLVTRQKWSSDCNHFAEQLKAKTEEYADLSDGECLLRVLGELEKLMEAKPHDLRTRYDMVEIAEDLCAATVRMLPAEKSAKFNGSTPADLMDYQLGKTFAGLQVAVGKLSGAQQDQVFEAIREFIAKMPADKQQFIMKQLGASELTEAVIRTAMLNGTLWTAFAVAVQVFGFAFYMMAAQLLAIISFHLLPFGAYIGLSSLLAVLSSPWMLPIFLVFGGWLYSHQNTGLRKSAVPMILLTLWISGMEMEARPMTNAPKGVDEALRLWGVARDCRDRHRQTAKDAKDRRDQAKAALDQTVSELNSAKSKKKAADARIKELTKSLAIETLSGVRAIAQGSWGLSDQAAARQVNEVEDRIARAKATVDSVQNWAERAWEKTKYWAGSYLKINAELTQVQNRLVEQVKGRGMSETTSYPPQIVSIFRGIEEQRSRVIDAHQAIEKLENLKSWQNSALDLAKQAFSKADFSRIKCERRYYGLEAV